MSVISKKELRSLLTATMQENEELRKENQKLLVVADATERIKKSNDIAEDYQQMSNELFEVIKTQYDAEFTVEDIQSI